MYDFSQIFETARVSYLLANQKAVVATIDSRTTVEEDLLEAVRFTHMTDLIETCNFLLDNDSARLSLEKKGYEAIVKRDISEVLKKIIPT